MQMNWFEFGVLVMIMITNLIYLWGSRKNKKEEETIDDDKKISISFIIGEGSSDRINKLMKEYDISILELLNYSLMLGEKSLNGNLIGLDTNIGDSKMTSYILDKIKGEKR